MTVDAVLTAARKLRSHLDRGAIRRWEGEVLCEGCEAAWRPATFLEAWSGRPGEPLRLVRVELAVLGPCPACGRSP